MQFKVFFSHLGFDFNTHLESKHCDFEENTLFGDRLHDSIFYYKSPYNTNTSFYLITTNLDSNEIEEIRKYIWNKNDADLIFYYPNENADLKLLYAKYSPKVNYLESILDTFSTTKTDTEKIEKIKRWQFDSGAFWLNYQSFTNKSKYKGIDKELIATLAALKERLNDVLSKSILDKKELNEVVQALIDRTLYIKYLEDNHIINSYFYNHYFDDASLNYEKLLENKSSSNINELFKVIHEIFNNVLFDKPTIDNKFLTEEVRNLIATSFKADLHTGQLRLFDFKFNVLPIEFISYIYEVFLSEKQKENGIYYTPKKLAQLIVDDVIAEDKIGSILDPSCGSGMFLIVAYQRLLEIAQKQGIEPEDSIEKIKFRIKLLSDNIFGIEKELTAQRFTIFSLSLQIFAGIKPSDIKEFIANELSEKNKVDLFSQSSFFNNIKKANTLSISEKSFEGKQFSYVVGNPPFFEIPNTAEFENEISFLDSYKVDLKNNTNVFAKNIVGKSQISQCFFLKIKDWSNGDTRFGFVSNSSSFYNDYSNKFQDFFYSNYGIEKIYELSNVKEILFEKAKESVIAIVFNNNYENNIIDYYPVNLGLLSKKPFDLLIIQEDKVIEIEQEKLISKQIKLRDFLVGNEYDNILTSRIRNNLTLNDFFSSLGRGFQIWGETAREKEYNLSKEDWAKLSKEEREQYLQAFINKYFSNVLTSDFNKPYIKPSNLSPFVKSNSNKFISSLENFERPIKNTDIYIGKKLIFTRIGSNLNCVYSKDNDYFDFSVYTIKLSDDNLYYLFQALLNSNIIQFYLDFYLRKRVFDSFSRIGNEDILSIPIPKELDQDLVNQISKISKDLTEGKYEYSEKEQELNELIFDLYELSYWEKQRIRDYFLPESKIEKKKNTLDNYKKTLKEIVGFYLKNPINIEESPPDFNLIVVKISLNNNSDTPKAEKVVKYLLNEIFEHNPQENFLFSQEKIYAKDCVYIIKENINKNWTETKAFEDGQDILKHLISNEGK